MSEMMSTGMKVICSLSSSFWVTVSISVLGENKMF